MRSICVSWLNSSLITSFFDNSQLFESLISSSLSIQSLSIADYCHCYYFFYLFHLFIVSLHRQIVNLWVRDFGVQWAQHATAMETETVHLCVTDSTSVCTINGEKYEGIHRISSTKRETQKMVHSGEVLSLFFFYSFLFSLYISPSSSLLVVCWDFELASLCSPRAARGVKKWFWTFFFFIQCSFLFFSAATVDRFLVLCCVVVVDEITNMRCRRSEEISEKNPSEWTASTGRLRVREHWTQQQQRAQRWEIKKQQRIITADRPEHRNRTETQHTDRPGRERGRMKWKHIKSIGTSYNNEKKRIIIYKVACVFSCVRDDSRVGKRGKDTSQGCSVSTAAVSI